MSDTKEKKPFNLYLFCSTIIIVICIFHLLFAIIFQSTCKIQDDKLVGYCYGGMYSFSGFLTLLVSKSSNITQIKSVSGLTNLAIGLPMVFIASLVSRNKKYILYVNSIIYLIDTIFMIPILIMGTKDGFNYKLTVADITMSIIFHIIFLAFFVFVIFIELKERKKKVEIKKEDILYMDEGE